MKKRPGVFDYALKIISIRDHSENELVRKLTNKDYTQAR